jgi:hypothetical protein
MLSALCWFHTDTQGCYPSQQRIALVAGYRERKVRDLLKSLEKSGLIKRRVTRSKGKFQRTEYRLFGTYQRQTGADRSDANHRHKKADGNHRQTGAEYEYRGTNNTGEAPAENVVTFPFQKIETSGGA